MRQNIIVASVIALVTVIAAVWGTNIVAMLRNRQPRQQRARSVCCR